MNTCEFWGHDTKSRDLVHVPRIPGHDTELRSSVHVPRIPGHDDELRDSVHVPRIPAVKVDLPGGITNNMLDGRAKEFSSDIAE